MKSPWKPRSLEDRLLHTYWSQAGGRLYLEVHIGGPGGPGNWPPSSKIRRIDGVLIRGIPDVPKAAVPYAQHSQEFYEVVEGRAVELIEVKRALGRYVIGQALAGLAMFERQYPADSVVPVILCAHGDPALEWFCEEHGIRVETAQLAF